MSARARPSSDALGAGRLQNVDDMRRRFALYEALAAKGNR